MEKKCISLSLLKQKPQARKESSFCIPDSELKQKHMATGKGGIKNLSWGLKSHRLLQYPRCQPSYTPWVQASALAAQTAVGIELK